MSGVPGKDRKITGIRLEGHNSRVWATIENSQGRRADVGATVEHPQGCVGALKPVEHSPGECLKKDFAVRGVRATRHRRRAWNRNVECLDGSESHGQAHRDPRLAHDEGRCRAPSEPAPDCSDVAQCPLGTSKLVAQPSRNQVAQHWVFPEVGLVRAGLARSMS